MGKDIPDWINTLALHIYQVIRKYDAMPRFQEMVNNWAEDHEAEVSDFLAWKKQRALHFRNNIATDARLQDEQAGPPEDGWQFQGDVQLIGKQTESGLQSSPMLIQGWVPRELATRPEITRILPLSRDHVLSLVEKYAILATIYDYGRKGTAELPPWEWPDLGERQTPEGMANAKKCMGFEALCRYVEDFAPEEEAWLRAMLDEVEEDVAKWAGGQPSDFKENIAGTAAETRADRIIRWVKDHRYLSVVCVAVIAVFFLAGGLNEVIDIYDRFTGRQQEHQVQEERLEDQPIVTATATVEIMIRSEEEVNAVAANVGAVLAFGKGAEALLTLSSVESKAEQTGMGEVRYSSNLAMKTTDKAFKQPLSFLRQIQYVHIRFGIIPPNSQVLSGKVICLFNNTAPIELSVPSQKMSDNFVRVSNIDFTEALRQLTKRK